MLHYADKVSENDDGVHASPRLYQRRAAEAIPDVESVL